jgi:hypothetical protein
MSKLKNVGPQESTDIASNIVASVRKFVNIRKETVKSFRLEFRKSDLSDRLKQKLSV